MIYWANKRVAEALDYGHDFAAKIDDGDDPILAPSLSAVVQAGDVVITQPALVEGNDQAFQLKVSGGTHQSLNLIKVYGETAAGRKVEELFQLRVRN